LLNIGDIISPFIGEAIKQYKFSVDNHHGNCTVDNNTGVIRLKSGVANPIFVSAVMMSSIGKWQLNQLTGGGGVPFLGSFHAKRLRIPLPPLSIQNEIADHITQIRSRAKQLQQEAKEGLEQAKRAVGLLRPCFWVTAQKRFKHRSEPFFAFEGKTLRAQLRRRSAGRLRPF
jgi:restriction endonuclease S subunit